MYDVAGYAMLHHLHQPTAITHTLEPWFHHLTLIFYAWAASPYSQVRTIANYFLYHLSQVQRGKTSMNNEHKHKHDNEVSSVALNGPAKPQQCYDVCLVVRDEPPINDCVDSVEHNGKECKNSNIISTVPTIDRLLRMRQRSDTRTHTHTHTYTHTYTHTHTHTYELLSFPPTMTLKQLINKFIIDHKEHMRIRAKQHSYFSAFRPLSRVHMSSLLAYGSHFKHHHRTHHNNNSNNNSNANNAHTNTNAQRTAYFIAQPLLERVRHATREYVTALRIASECYYEFRDNNVYDDDNDWKADARGQHMYKANNNVRSDDNTKVQVCMCVCICVCMMV